MGTLYTIIMQELTKPLLRRAGTALGLFLAGHNVPAETSAQIVTGLTAAALVAVDLINSHIARKGAK